MDELEQAGYTVTEASDGVVYVEGHGLAIYVRADDTDAITALVANPAQQLSQLPEDELRAQAAAVGADAEQMSTDQMIDAVLRAAEE